MNDDRGHVAMPKLYGAPAYARPPVVPVKCVERPFDPDDLPLECEREDDDGEQGPTLSSRPYGGLASPGSSVAPPGGSSGLRGRPFRLGDADAREDDAAVAGG